MKRRHFGLAVLSLALIFMEWTAGAPSAAHQDSPTIPPSPPGIRDADQFPGADLGAQINSAVASLGPAGGVVRIHSGSYTWKSAVTIDPRKVSLSGDGSPFVQITCAAPKCLELQEQEYSIWQGGSVGGFTLNGSATTSNQTGIEASGIIGEKYDDIVLQNFSAAGSVALSLYNSAASNGWTERTTMHRLRFDNNRTGLLFKYNTRNAEAASFGYSNLELECDTVKAGQTCIEVRSGRLYHSQLIVFADVEAGGTLILLPGTTSGYDHADTNFYRIFAEGDGTGLSVGRGARFTGYGTVDFGGMAVKNDNPSTFDANVRVIQGPTEVVNGDGGTFENFLETGNAATVYPELVRDIGTPTAGFGFLEGKNISSAYVSLYGGAPNAFEVLACPFHPRDFGGCSAVTSLDTSGNVHTNGALYSHGTEFAESVHTVAGRYEPGDVLAIDAGGESRFQLSNGPYSTRVAGVYSTRPGVLGGWQASDSSTTNEIPLAIHGIAPCKVSAENGSIVPGDLLVSASSPGYAMKGTDPTKMTGAVIGKSLGSLPRGKGTVPALIALQ